MSLLKSTFFTIFMLVWSMAYALFLILTAPFFSLKNRFKLVFFYGQVILFMLQATCGLSHSVEGLENIPNEPHVALWKHGSSWEVFAQFLIGPPKVLVLKHELLWIPFFGIGLKLLRSIAIHRGGGISAVNQVLNQGQARLAEGLSVLVFPEGTRMTEGETRRYGISGALLASQAGCKLLPVAHDAAYYWPRRGLNKKKGVIRLIIGPPIDATGCDPRELNDQVQAWIEMTIKRIRREST